MNLKRRLKHRVLRLLGVVSPSGAALATRWAMSKLGRSRYYPNEPKRGLNIASPSDVLALLGSDVARGPLPVRDPGTHFRLPTGALTTFGTGDPQHTHGWTAAGECGPGSGYQVNCFTQQPCVPGAALSESVCHPRSGCVCGSQPSGCAESQSGGEGSC